MACILLVLISVLCQWEQKERKGIDQFDVRYSILTIDVNLSLIFESACAAKKEKADWLVDLLHIVAGAA